MPLNCSASNLPSWEPRPKVAPAFCESKRTRLAGNIAPPSEAIERIFRGVARQKGSRDDLLQRQLVSPAQRKQNAALRDVESLRLAVLIESIRRVHFDVGQQGHQAHVTDVKLSVGFRET